jgi:hypothetical protein
MHSCVATANTGARTMDGGGHIAKGGDAARYGGAAAWADEGSESRARLACVRGTTAWPTE